MARRSYETFSMILPILKSKSWQSVQMGKNLEEKCHISNKSLLESYLQKKRKFYTGFELKFNAASNEDKFYSGGIYPLQ